MPTLRIGSATGRPASACFSTATICSTAICFRFTARSPSPTAKILLETNFALGPISPGADQSRLGTQLILLPSGPARDRRQAGRGASRHDRHLRAQPSLLWLPPDAGFAQHAVHVHLGDSGAAPDQAG